MCSSDLDDALKKIEAIILSMTPTERERPDLLNGSRRARLATGSGNSVQEVNQFLKQFEQMKKMARRFGKPKAALDIVKTIFDAQ